MNRGTNGSGSPHGVTRLTMARVMHSVGLASGLQCYHELAEQDWNAWLFSVEQNGVSRSCH